MNPITRRDILKAGAAAGLAPLTRFANAWNDDRSFTFAFFSDTHVRLQGNIEENRLMFNEIKALQPAFAINGGDVTDYGWAGEFDNYQMLVRELGIKVHDTAGNHDVRWSPQGVKIFREKLGDPYSYFDHNGVHFLILDSTVPLSHWGHYEAEQLKWLEAKLKSIGRRDPVFLATHHWVGRDAVMVDNEEELRKIIEPYNIKIILNAHGHSDLLWNWDGITNTMNKGLYQGSWEKVEVDFDKGEVRLSRRTTQRPNLRLITRVPLSPSSAKRPVWAIGQLPLEKAYESAVAEGAQVRTGYGKWLTVATAPSLAMLLGESGGQQVVELRDPKTGNQSTYIVETETDGLKKLWRTKLSGGVMSHVKIDGNRLFVSCMDGSLNCLDKNSGKVVWKAKTGRYCHSSPVIDGDRVYVGSADANFYAFSKDSGKELWRLKTEGPVYASAAVAGEVVCVASGDGKFYAVDRNTGQTKWVYEMPKSNTAFAQTHATTDGERFYIGAWDSHVYALTVDSGSLVWRQPCFPRTFAWSPAIGGPCLYEGKIYVPANGNGLFCFDAKSGEQLWMVSSKTDKYGHSSPRIRNGKVYVGGLGDIGELRCVSAADGSLIWIGKTGSVIYDSSPALGDGFVAIGSVGSLLSIFDDTTGNLLKQTRMPIGHFLASPAAEGRRIYAGTYSNTVTAFELA
ncbi:MAG TPA: PQQ-binding-like beta-propeller repeat protein [Fimbriimonadaceae bacterium]|nr:PQQ-binding-like beta-propeller repeat protein [Fimbriimonadaceae bacterium]